MRKDRVVSEVLGEELAITPSDLYNTEFKNAIMGGYDKQEVDAFLERVADAYEAVINQVRELKETLESQRDKMQAMADMENTLRNALITAQKYSESIQDSAQREANALLEEARMAKQRAEMQAMELPGELKAEIHELRLERNRLRMDLRAVLSAHGALLADIPGAEDLRRTANVAELFRKHDDDGAIQDAAS
jgi:cell division initiation protein